MIKNKVPSCNKYNYRDNGDEKKEEKTSSDDEILNYRSKTLINSQNLQKQSMIIDAIKSTKLPTELMRYYENKYIPN